MKDKIFERYIRISDESTQRISGIGLGLCICWGIIEQHDNIIYVQSEEDTGSAFFFTLPYSN